MPGFRFVNALVFVADMKKAMDVYCGLLGQKVAQDHGDFVQLENGLALHTGAALQRTIFGDGETGTNQYGRRNLVLYFDAEDLDAAYERVAPHVTMIHPIEAQSWGQRVFRFYDHDGHIVEVGEPQ